MLRAILIAVLSLPYLVGCAAYRTHRLATPVADAPSRFEPIALCASDAGYDVTEHDKSVHIRVDDVSWVQFIVQEQSFNMVVLVDDKKVGPAMLDAKFAETKEAGDGIFACAEAR